VATDGTWNAVAPASFLTEADPPWVDGVKATNGGTVRLLSEVPPNAGKPATGTYAFLIDADINAAFDDWLGGASIGNVTITCEAMAGGYPVAMASAAAVVTGNLNLQGGEMDLLAGSGVTGTTTIGPNGWLSLYGTPTLVGAAVSQGFLIVTYGVTATFTAGLTLSGDLAIEEAASISGPVALTGTVKLLSDWPLTGEAVNLANAAVVAGGNVTINGTAAISITHSQCCVFSNGSGKTLTVDYLPVQTVPIHAYCGVVNGGHNHASAVVYHPGPPGTMLTGVAA